MHAVYFFRTIEPKYPVKRNKVSGLFNIIEDLSNQLNKDILFFRQQHLHMARIDIFSKLEYEKKLFPQLNEQHRNFLLFNLFIDILPEIPPLQITSQDIRDKFQIIQTIPLLHQQETGLDHQNSDTNVEQLNRWSENPAFSQIILRIHQLNMLNDLFI